MSVPSGNPGSIAGFLVILFFAGDLAASPTDDPIPATNLTPFTAVLGAPALRSANLAHSDGWQIDSALASHSAIGLGDGELAYIDGETLRLALEIRRRIADGWQLGLTIPWFRHRQGFLDSLIDRWHGLTGLPDGQRDRQPAGELLYFYDGRLGDYALSRSAGGLGDIRVELLRALQACPRAGCTRARHAAIRLSVELASGDPMRLTGNGATDWAADLLFSGRRTLHERPFGWHAQLGVLRPGSGALLPHARAEFVAIGGAGLYWRWRPAAGLFAQAAANSQPWRSATGELGGVAIELTAGLRWHGRHGAWHVALSEDLLVDRSPDVVVRFGWRAHPASSP